ncbi:MFS transporter [Ferroglobus sp.]|uniref:MFS transporter n=1 Tax=Ferroglobus sp. TaxID=2614230 RepID=UPI0025BE87CB|nr:MFS transporter [Ferroglobus sp.]
MRKAVLMAIVPASFLTPFTLSSVNVALPSIGNELKVDAITLNWIATAFLLSSAMFLVPFGRLADIKGRKKIFVLGMVIFTVGSLLSGLAFSAEMLIAFRILQGIGGAMIFATGIAILTSVFPLKERGKILGINVASVYTGLSLGPFFGGILTQNFGWRSVFLVNVPIGIFIVILAALKLKAEWADARGESFDFIGSVIYSLMLLFIMLGFSESNLSFLFAGFSLLLLFIFWESRIDHPILEIELFKRNATFTLSNLAALLNYSATFAVAYLLSLYLQYIKALTPQQAGFVLVSQPVMQALFSPFAGWLSDRVEPRVVASAGMAVTALGLLIFSTIDENTKLSLIISNLMLMGFGFALFSSPNTNAIMSSVERKFYGLASATLSTMRVVGQMLSMAIVMLIFAIYIGKALITPKIYPLLLESTRTSFAVFSVLCFFGIFASLARGRVR